MMIKNYSTAGIIQSVRGCPSGFTCLLCLEKNWRIMQPMKARSRTMIQAMKGRSDDDLTNEGKIERWSSHWRQYRTMIQPMKTRSDDDPINEGKIGRW